MALLLAGPLLSVIRRSSIETTAGETEACHIVLPEADLFSFKSGTPPHYKAFKTNPHTGQKELIGAVFVTTDVAPQVKGYGGSIRIMAGMDTQGTLTGIRVLSHSETASYTGDLTIFAEQFASKNISDPLELGSDIDAITGATMTSQAMTEAVRKSARKIAQSVFEKGPGVPSEGSTGFPFDQILMPLILFAVAVLGVVSHNSILRWATLTGGLIYLGILRGTMISIVDIANISLLNFPDFVRNPLWYMVMGLTLVTGLLWGLVFCGSLCPFAALQEVLFCVSRKLNIKAPLISSKALRQARYIKYGVLVTALVISLVLGHTAATGLEPYLTLFSGKGSPLAWGLVTLMLTAAMFHFRFWCRYLCPVGACLGLLARVSPFRIRLDSNCTGCGSCEEICPTGAITLHADNRPVINHQECILCGTCVRGCQRKALNNRGPDDKEC